MPDCTRSVSDPAAWHANLRLRFARDTATRLAGRSHSGPLRVQKPLYPEGPAICHAIVVHPPGGVVGGDALDIGIDAGAGAHCLLTTPGAAKWYRANGKVSRQIVRIAAADGAQVEWLPQESIFFDAADVQLTHEVELAASARYIGSEILCFGRRASGERFNSGRVGQRSSIRLGGKLVWWEQGALGSSAIASPLGLAGASVCATLTAVGPVLPAPLVAAIRALDAQIAVSQVKPVFVVRYLGDDSEAARQLMAAAWQLLRPFVLGCPAPLPRIWNT